MSDFVVVPNQLVSVLSAVNAMLATLGDAPVSTIDPPPVPEVSIALGALDLTDQTVQGMRGTGWTWNREEGVTLQLDTDSKVPLPDQALMVTAAYYTPGQLINVVPRGAFLYDRLNHTFQFSEAPIVDYVARLSWDQLPSQARLYILYLATQVFQANMASRTPVLQVNAQVLNLALVSLEQLEDTQAQFNTIQGNATLQASLGSSIRNRQGL